MQQPVSQTSLRMRSLEYDKGGAYTKRNQMVAHIYLIKRRRSKWQRSIGNAGLELEQAVETVEKLDDLGL